MNNIIYLRVSSEDGRQDETNQLNDCMRLFNDLGLEGCDIYKERTSAYKDKAMPELDKIFSLVYQNKVSNLILWDMSRLTRKGVDDTISKWRILTDYNVNTYFVKHPELNMMNNQNEIGKAMKISFIAMLGAMNKIESMIKSERVKIAYQNRKNKWGRKEIKINRFEVLRKYNELKSIRKVAEQFNVSRSVIHRIIQNK